MENILALQALDTTSDALYSIARWSTVSIDCCDVGTFDEVLRTIGS